MMDLDELRSVQSRERQTDSLQQLRASFYRDAGAFIEGLREERERAAERADDPWNDPEISRLSDDIETAEDTVEAIYERRVGKIVKMASLAAADMPTDDEGLTAEERGLFESLVAEIEASRDRVEAVLDGDDPDAESSVADDGRTDPAEVDTRTADDRTAGDSAAADRETAPQPPEPDVGAADLMGGGDVEDQPGTSAKLEPEPEPESASRGESDGSDPGRVDPDPDRSGSESDRSGPEPERTHGPEEDNTRTDDHGTSAGSPPEPEASGVSETTADRSETEADRSEVPESPEPPETAEVSDEPADVDRSTVKITADVGEIMGVEGRSYDLSTSDVVTLPDANAEPLVERGAAERLD